MSTAFLVIAILATIGVVFMVFGVGVTHIRRRTHYSRKEYALLLLLCAIGVGSFFAWSLISVGF
jgi:formate hydrogenlyase subunit 3/multisubunit Na+/H+ antiporter MnhD subunit